MKSLKNISKKDATLLLRALRDYSQSYYQYKGGRPYLDRFVNSEEADKLMAFTETLADKIGLDSEAGY